MVWTECILHKRVVTATIGTWALAFHVRGQKCKKKNKQTIRRKLFTHHTLKACGAIHRPAVWHGLYAAWLGLLGWRQPVQLGRKAQPRSLPLTTPSNRFP